MTLSLAGYACPWGVPSVARTDTRGRWFRTVVDEAGLDRWLDLEMGCPLLVDHIGYVSSHGVSPIGTVRLFHPDPFGLLVLGEVDDEFAEGVERAVCDGTLWAMSAKLLVGATDPPEPEPGPRATELRIRDALLEEISLVNRPAFPDAKVLATGADAQAIWDMPGLADLALAARTAG